MSLIEASMHRISGDLPDFAPGASVPDKLLAGRDAAGAVIRKYVPNFEFDIDEAQDTVREIDLWAQRNKDDLEQLMESHENNLPKVLQIELGAKGVQDFILAGFTTAASGLGPWASNKIGKIAQKQPMMSGARIDNDWAIEDARYRLDVFGMIVKLEQDGEMKKFFEPPSSVQGLGALPAVAWWAIAIIVVGLAAVIISYLYLNKRLELNNKIMRDICEKAQEEGDRETIEQCIEATKELQVDPFQSGFNVIGKTVMIIGIAYIGVRYALPWVAEQFGKSKKIFA